MKQKALQPSCPEHAEPQSVRDAISSNVVVQGMSPTALLLIVTLLQTLVDIFPLARERWKPRMTSTVTHSLAPISVLFSVAAVGGERRPGINVKSMNQAFASVAEYLKCAVSLRAVPTIILLCLTAVANPYKSVFQCVSDPRRCSQSFGACVSDRCRQSVLTSV